jgi:CHAT domain-containing protein/Flp pilus assembly protein TadD
MRRAIFPQAIRSLSLFQTAAIWLLALSSPARAADQTFDVVVKADSTRVMAGEKPIGDVQKDMRLTVTQTNGDWYLIDMPNANPPQQGWIRESDVQLAPESPATPQLAAEQQEQLKRRDWQTTDSRLALEKTSLLEKLSVVQRRELAEADRLSGQVGALYHDGKYRDAIQSASWIVEKRREILGEKNSDYATSLNDLAMLYGAAGEYAKAEPLFQRALAIRKEVLGEKHPNYARSLNDLAGVYFHKGAYAKAEPFFQKALAIRAEALGEKDPEYATSLNDLAVLYGTMGEYAKAESLYLKASAIWLEVLGEKHRNYASSLLNLAALYMITGDYAKAEPLYRKSSMILKEVLGERHPDYATSLDLLAELYSREGDYVKAEPLYQKALAIRKVSLGEKHPEYATSLNDLALLYEHAGDFAKAEPLYMNASEILKEALGEKSPAYARSLSDLASLYDDMGEYAKAEPLFQKALAIRKEVLGEKHPDFAQSLNNLAGHYYLTNEFAKAKPLYLKALAIRNEAFGEKLADYASDLCNLAALYVNMGEYATAEPLHQKALALRKAALGEKHPDYAGSLYKLAYLYDEMGNYAKAEPLSAQSLQILREQLDLSASLQSERQQLRMADAVRSNLDGYLSFAEDAKTPAPEVYAQVLLWKGAVSARQQAMRRMRATLESTHSPALMQLFDDLTATSRELSNQSQLVPNLGAAGAHQKKLAELSDRVEQLQQELTAKSQTFRRQLADRHRAPEDIRQALPTDAVLVDMLEYNHHAPREKGKKSVWERRFVAFIVRRDRPVERIELGPVAPIAKQIEAWRKSFGIPSDAQAANPGQELRRLVWDKLEPFLAGARTVLISPDGATARFPWAALPGKKPGTYLIEDTAIAVLPIPQLLPEVLAINEPAESDAPSLLLVGGVDFGADPGREGSVATDRGAARGDGPMHWQPLSGTLAEVANVKATFARRYPRTVLHELTGASATKQAVRDEVIGCRYLHFSTHGFFAPLSVKSALGNNPREDMAGLGPTLTRQDVSGFHPDLLCGLVLAGANRPVVDGQDDGILTAMEVAGLDLSHVDLATLSACETGLGESAGGEGLLGLQRAFQLAGAKTTVASLWQVPDRATKSLMSRFYENLWQRRMSKLEALREAQQWLIREGPKQSELLRGRGLELDSEPENEVTQSGRLSPRYWAAFELSGDWR